MILISNHHLSLQDIRQGANAFPFKNKNQKSLLSFNTCEAQYRIFELMEGKKKKTQYLSQFKRKERRNRG